MHIKPENLPAKLRETGLFCGWRYETRPGSEKPTKVPYDPKTGNRAKSTDPATFASLDTALTFDGDGVGVGIFGDLGAIDIDHCIDDAGAISPMAMDIMSTMNTYIEYSPSGNGLRILFTAEGFQYDRCKYYINNQKLGLEVYIAGCTNKYVTVTGDALAPGYDLEERGAELAAVLERYMVRPTEKAPAPLSVAPSAPVELDDLTLIEKAKQGKNGAAFTALWAGNTTGYKSQSEADLALCNALAWWTNGDAARVDRLFRMSGLMREKWDRKQSGSTYGAITVQSAVNSTRGGYNPATYTGEGYALDWDGSRDTGAAPVPRPEQSLKPPDYSDAGNAVVFSSLYREDLIYVDALGWLWWNGRRWERDDHMALAWAVALSGRMLREALSVHKAALVKHAEAQAKYAETGAEEDGEAVNKAKEEISKAKAFLKHAQGLRRAGSLNNMQTLSIPTLVIKAEKLDANPFDLNTPAGIVNLTTGELRPHDRLAYCSQITEAAPGDKGKDVWASFLETITCGDGSVQGFLQMVAGMALIGTVYQEGIVIAHGGGRNGKSTFFNALGQVLGDYAGTMDIATLTTERGNRGASLATLRGKRLVVAGELEEHQRLSVATLKKVASTDKLTIEEKYKQPETVKQTHTLVLFTNHLPRVGSTDGGTWRRLIVVPFNATIPPGKGVQNYAEVLARDAGPAILSWAIEGAVNFVRNGFKLDIPDTVAEATEEYRQREDWLANFINERCVLEPNARVQDKDLFLAYRQWAQDSGEFARRKTDFATAMETAGYSAIYPKNKKTWIGLRIDYAQSYENPYSATG